MPATEHNVSPMEISRTFNSTPDATQAPSVGSFNSQVEQIAREENIDTRMLRFEITESVLMEDPIHGRKVLQELTDKGFRVLLDDFGTGYSSFSYLKDLPFYQVKLDASFIEKLEKENRSFKIFSGIVNLAHTIGLEIVAEGIETPEQLELAREAGCDCVQGYYTSRPVTVEQAYEMVSNHATIASQTGAA